MHDRTRISEFWARGGQLDTAAWSHKAAALARPVTPYEEMSPDEWASLPEKRRRAAFREVYGYDEPRRGIRAINYR